MSSKASFNIQGLSCGACALSSEKILRQTQGIQWARVNFASQTAYIEWDETQTNIPKFTAQLAQAGFELHTRDNLAQAQALSQAATEKQIQSLYRDTLGAWILGLPLLVLGMSLGHHNLPWLNWLNWFLASWLVLYFGRRFFVKAWQLLKQGRSNMDSLIALGSGTAYLSGTLALFTQDYWLKAGLSPPLHFESAGLVIAFVLLGKWLEWRSRGQSSQALNQLLALQNPQARLIDPEQGQHRLVPIDCIQIHDQILVQSGERVPLDGFITKGQSDLDESMLSGEAIPLSKGPGAEVFSGSLNLMGSLQIRVSKNSENSTLQQIAQMVAQAQSSQAPIQNLVDKIASYFVPSVLILALLTLGFWTYYLDDFSKGLLSAISLLVIACPCALGLATPMSLLVSIEQAAKAGILIQDAKALETAAKIQIIALDKTGTLTQGQPKLLGLHWQMFLVFRSRQLESIILGLEKNSSHPIARSLVQTFEAQGQVEHPEIQDFKTLPGLGVQGRVQDQTYFLGNAQLLAQHNISMAGDISEQAQMFSDKGYTLVFFANQQTVLAVLGFGDPLRPQSKRAVQKLQQQGYRLVMLTGDQAPAAQRIAQQVGITEVHSGLLPEDKMRLIQGFQEQGFKVAMVGDGINDAPALAAADLGLAMNNGMDIALEASGMVLRNNDPEQILRALALAKMTWRLIRQNLFWAFAYNLLALPLAAGLLYPWTGLMLDPMWAGAAMAFSSVSVVLNSLRIKLKS